MISFEKIVNKLGKQENEIITNNEIGIIFDPDYLKNEKKYYQKVNKIIYRLKALKIISPIKNGLYYVSNGKNINLIDVIDNNYWKIIKKICTSLTMGNYFIGGNKSLEIYLKNYSIQDKLIVYSKDIQKIIKISENKSIHFKKIHGGQKNPKLNSYKFIENYIKRGNIDGINFNISSTEFALLDSLNIHDNKEQIDYYQINKFLNKYKHSLDKDILQKLVSYKYISAINRLRVHAKKTGYNELYQVCLEIIKTSGGNCFISF